MNNQNKEIKRVGDLFTEGQIFQGAERINFKDIVDKELVILDGVMIKNRWDRNSVVIKFKIVPDEKEYSTITSGQVIVRKFETLIKENAFPILGRFIKVKNYYDVI